MFSVVTFPRCSHSRDMNDKMTAVMAGEAGENSANFPDMFPRTGPFSTVLPRLCTSMFRLRPSQPQVEKYCAKGALVVFRA